MKQESLLINLAILLSSAHIWAADLEEYTDVLAVSILRIGKSAAMDR